MNNDFTNRIISIRGDIGKQWLEELPSLIEFYKSKWELTLLSPFALSYNYVIPGKTVHDEAVVLKLSFPNNHEFITEVEALRFYSGNGSIQLIKEDLDNSVILLERAVPGTRIGDIQPDKKQISLVSDVIKKIHKTIIQKDASSFPTLLDWSKAFERYRKNFDVKIGPIPARMFEQAEEIFIEYSKNINRNVLLHGDLHNDNILLSDRGWLIIDPKGVIGEQAFDVGTYLRNPYIDLPENSNYKNILKNRIAQFSEELDLEKKKIKNWAFANAVISLLWFLEDEKKFNDVYLRNAELILGIEI